MRHYVDWVPLAVQAAKTLVQVVCRGGRKNSNKLRYKCATVETLPSARAYLDNGTLTSIALSELQWGCVALSHRGTH